MRTAEVTIHPKAASLLSEISRLKDQLGAVIEQISLLRHRSESILTAMYAEKVGFLEYQLLCSEIDVRVVRRRIELVTARINQGEEITSEVIQDIEASIKTEMHDWWAKAYQREEDLKSNMDVLQNLTELDRKTHERVKRCYRRLCQLLHPDVVGEQTDLYLRHWQQVQDAYSACDADLLESLLSVVLSKSTGPDVISDKSFDDLAIEAFRLETLLEKQIDALAAVKSEPPFCYEELLQNDEWVAEKRKTLKSEIAASLKECERLEATLEFLTQSKPERLN